MKVVVGVEWSDEAFAAVAQLGLLFRPAEVVLCHGVDLGLFVLIQVNLLQTRLVPVGIRIRPPANPSCRVLHTLVNSTIAGLKVHMCVKTLFA